MKRYQILIAILIWPHLALAAMQGMVQAPATNKGDVRAAINVNATRSNANFAEHETEINVLAAGKIDKGGIAMSDGVAVTGSGTAADPYVIPGRDFVAQTTAPADTAKIWIDTDQDNVIKAYIGGVWTVIGSAGSGDDLGSATATDVTALFSGAGDYLKADGTKGTPSGTGAVDSVNTKTGSVVLDADDISDTASTAKFTTAAEKAIWNSKQTRVTGSCTGGDSVQAVAADGTVTCTAAEYIDLAVTAPLILNSTTGVISIDTTGAVVGDVIKRTPAGIAWGSDVTGGGEYAEAITVAPYSDVSCSTGKYDTVTNRYYPCIGGYHTAYLSGTAHSNPQPSIPTLTSRTIGTNGTTLTLVGSASLSVGSGGNGGFDVDCSTAGSGITATYSSGAPGASLVYNLGTTVNSGDTCDLDYAQPGNGIEATTGGADLASITSAAIANNSTQSAATYIFEDDFADNASGWTFGGASAIANGYLSITNGTYAYAAIDVAPFVTQGQQYTANFDIIYMSGGANWLRFDYPAGTAISGYYTATGNYSVTFTAGASGSLRFLINDNAVIEYRLDNFKLCAGTTCN